MTIYIKQYNSNNFDELINIPTKADPKFRLGSKIRIHSFLYKNVVFPAQAEYFYFSADFRLKIFLYYIVFLNYSL